VNQGPKQLKGRKLGDRRVRIERPHAAYFRYSPEGTLVAKQAASVPRTRAGRLFARIRAGAHEAPVAGLGNFARDQPAGGATGGVGVVAAGHREGVEREGGVPHGGEAGLHP
jgi:hypothetical protein